MAPLRVMKRVNRFPASNNAFFDEFAYRAFQSTASEQEMAYIDGVRSTWHRPPGSIPVLEQNLAPYGDSLPGRCFDGDYLAILKKTIDQLRPSEKLIPLTLGAAASNPRMEKSTSPGFPWIHQGYSSKRDVLSCPLARGKISRAWDSIGRGIPWSLPDCLAFHRIVASEKPKEKERPVWGFPTEVILEEARFFFPLLDHLTDHCNENDSFYGLGMETMRSGHSHLARNFTSESVTTCLNADLSQFDAHVPAWIIRDVFSHVSSWFDFTKVKDSEGKIWNVRPEQTCRRWKALVAYFINTKIRTPSGYRFQKSQGVPSGSMWTNFIDTCVNAVQMRVACRRVTGELPRKDYYYGDDSTIFLREAPDLDAWAEVLQSVFGGILSLEKTILTDNAENIHWLGYFYRTTGPRRSLDFILASTLFPEREVLRPIETCARLLGQLYSTMDPVVSVRFHDAISWIMREYVITTHELEDYVRSLPTKAMKFLLTLGLDIQDVTLPPVQVDPLGTRRIDAVLPSPSPRNFFRYRDVNLPRCAFVPEAYQNVHLRSMLFNDFSSYIETFSSYNDFDSDEAFFHSD